MKIRTLLPTIILSIAFLSCDVVSQTLNFANCKYQIDGIAAPSIAGISLNNITDVDNLSATSLLKLSTALLTGSLPLLMTININATNPNSTKAEIAGLEWALDLENTTMFTGNVGNRVSIPANGGQAIIPLNFNIDLLDVFKNDSRDDILNFVQGVLDVGESTSKVSLRIKPTLEIGGRKLSTGFVTLSKNVGNS